MDELKGLLQKVSDSYDDFVNGVLSVAKQSGIVDEMIDYIKTNPEADSSGITQYMFSL